MNRLARDLLDGFLDALPTAGLPVLVTRRVDFQRALTLTDLRSLDDLYWAARLTLLSGPEQIAPFDRLFDAWFRAGVATVEAVAPPTDDEAGATPKPMAEGEEPPPAAEPSEGAGREASRDELRNLRRLPRATPDERAIWARMTEVAPAALPRAVGRRQVRSRRPGSLDLRRSLAQARRTGGEVTTLAYRRRPRRPRRMLILIDVSGSQKAHSPDMLRFAHALTQAAERCETFTFGTRLTRVTDVLRQPDVDQALAALTDVVLDFDGGTRIGETFERLLANGRFVAFARGATIVVVSDGLERGDPEPMRRATARLARLGHRLLWLSPLAGDPAYRPETRGMRAILPALDRLGDASSPAALLREVERLTELERRPRGTVAVEWRHRQAGRNG
ncbi:MAG TPA: VWA domain-containing protein [Thermomicrobiales bacterium]|nr:VWA domain-containing protein [Thermomicrobiales bacterium]